MNIESIQQIQAELQELKLKCLRKGLKEGNLGDLNKYFNERYIEIGLKMLKDLYDEIEEKIYQMNKRKHKYEVIKKDYKSILTSLGEVRFKRRLYRDKKGNSIYLFDQMMELRKGARITVDAISNIFEEVIVSSYGKGGKHASISDSVSKQTVMNLLKQTVIPKKDYFVIKKKVVDYLYVEADEDHIALQREYELSAINKLIYVHEGIEPEAPKSERNKLINAHYFGHVDVKKGDNLRLWSEVREYIEKTYEVSKIKKIYLNGDGGAWIQEGMSMFKKMTFVMDKFHITEYVNRMTSHLKDSQNDAKEELYRLLYKHNRDAYDVLIGRLYMTAKNKVIEKTIKECDTYFRNNFESICLRFSKDEHILGCSAEGHVSHVLASRMSSRPMGWTIEGANKITKLRIYKLNGGDIYDLVNANNQMQLMMQTFKSGHDETEVYSASVINADINKKSHDELKYIEHYHASLTPLGKKVLSINNIKY